MVAAAVVVLLVIVVIAVILFVVTLALFIATSNDLGSGTNKTSLLAAGTMIGIATVSYTHLTLPTKRIV